MTYEQKIIFGEISGVRDMLIYCRDHRYCTTSRPAR